jgi:hypothetical protein
MPFEDWEGPVIGENKHYDGPSRHPSSGAVPVLLKRPLIRGRELTHSPCLLYQ